MSNSETRFYIGTVGQFYGYTSSTAQKDADIRAIRRLLFSVGEGYFLPDISLNIGRLVDSRSCLVHRTDGDIDGVVFFENVDVQHGRFGSSNRSSFRITSLRSLAVAENSRRGYIAYRLVREAQLRGAIFSPHDSRGLALRAVAAVASIHAGNSNAIKLAQRVGAVIGTTDSVEVDHHPAIRGYALESHEKANLFDQKSEFVIAVLNSTDLFEAANLHRLGELNGATYEGPNQVIVKYDPGDVCPDLLASAVSGLRNGDKGWLSRLGLDDGPDVQGLGTIHHSRVTHEMCLTMAG